MTSLRARAARAWGDRELRPVWVLFLVALLIRLATVGARGFTDDYLELLRWANGMVAFGPWTFYERIGGPVAPNYPALLYPLWALGALLDGPALRDAVKGLVIPFDLGIGAVLYRLVRTSAGPGTALLAAALYLLNPAVIIAGPYWGQVDAAGVLPLLLAFWAMDRRHYGRAGAAAALAALVKPQFGVIALVAAVALLVGLLRRREWLPIARAAGGALAVYAAIALPLRLGPLQLIGNLREQAGFYPLTSLYALNPWGVVVGFNVPDAPYALTGLLLLGLGMLAAVTPLWRRQDLAALLAAALFVTFAAYFLPTRVHERYLFAAMVLLAPFAATRARLLGPYVAMSLIFAVGLLYVLWRVVSVAGLAVPREIERTLFTEPAMKAIAVALMSVTGYVIWRLARGDMTLVPSTDWPERVGSLVVGARTTALRPPASPVAVIPARAMRLTVALLLALPTALGAVWLWPELASSVPKVNDEMLHFVFIQRAWEALLRGENVFDFWVPEMEHGFPEFLYYQHLPHLAVMALHKLVLGLPDPYLFFNAVRYALLLAFPFTVYWSMRRMGFTAVAAGFGAAVSPLIHSEPGFGLEYGSYIWRGYGLFTQLFGAHLLFVTMALVRQVLDTGQGRRLAALAFAALALSHLAYAYMMGITVLVLLVLGARRGLRRQVRDVALIGAVTLALSAYMVIPFVLQSAYLQVSPYLPRFRFDGFGLPQVIAWLANGSLLDDGRAPVLTVLLGLGTAVALATRTRVAVLSVLLLAVWVILYAGRVTLGPVADLFPFSNGLPVHRFLAGIHLAAILLIGIAGDWIWRSLRPARPGWAAALAVAALVVLLLPALAERRDYYIQNAAWMEETRAAIARDTNAARVVERLRALPPGRVYAGLPASWGGTLDFGVRFRSLRLYHLLIGAGLPVAAPPIYSWSLNSDLTWDFDDRREADYELFNVRYVVAPQGLAMPGFLRQLAEYGPYRIYEAPTAGYADLVAIAERRGVADQPALFRLNREWARGEGPVQDRYIRYDYPAPAAVAQVDGRACPGGRTDETIAAASVRVRVECGTASALVLRTTYHPNWRVTIDGVAAETFMLSPSYLGVEVPAGGHEVLAEYRSHPLKAPLLVLAAVALALLASAGRLRDRLGLGR